MYFIVYKYMYNVEYMYNYKFCILVNVVYFSVGRFKYVRVMVGALEGDVFFGLEVEVIY